jgi:hypothetical protein
MLQSEATWHMAGCFRKREPFQTFILGDFLQMEPLSYEHQKQAEDFELGAADLCPMVTAFQNPQSKANPSHPASPFGETVEHVTHVLPGSGQPPPRLSQVCSEAYFQAPAKDRKYPAFISPDLPFVVISVISQPPLSNLSSRSLLPGYFVSLLRPSVSYQPKLQERGNSHQNHSEKLVSELGRQHA